jgi:hypothetical protein
MAAMGRKLPLTDWLDERPLTGVTENPSPRTGSGALSVQLDADGKMTGGMLQLVVQPGQ